MSTPPSGLVNMTGRYKAVITVLVFDSKEVASWLPPELVLAPQKITPPGTHPVNLLLGDERRVHFNVTPCINFRYHEFALVIPYTRWRDPIYAYNGPFLFTPIIFVDNSLVSWGGEVVFGFPKEDANFQIGNGRYVVTNNNKSPYASANIRDLSSSPTPAARETISKLIQQPSISQKQSGRYVGSGFWWGLPEARLTDTTVEGEIIKYLLPNVRDGRMPLNARGTSELSNGGAFRIETKWTLTLPGPPTKDWSPWNDAGPLPRGEGDPDMSMSSED